MGFVAVSYLFGIVMGGIGYYIFKKYPGKRVGMSLAVVFSLIGVFVFIYSIVMTVVMVKHHRSY